LNTVPFPSETRRLKEWLTAREIAAEELPGLPTTKSAVIRFAKREGWSEVPSLTRDHAGFGGGLEYHYRLFPTLAQVTYVQRYMVVGSEPVQPKAEPETSVSAALTDRARRERDARLAVVAAFETFSKGLAISVQASMFIFCDRWNMNMIQADAWVKDILPQISQRSVFRWRSAKQAGAKDKLAVDRSEARKGKGLLETANSGEVRRFILAWIAANPALSADVIRGYCEHHFGSELTDRNGELKPLPPPRTFQHFIAQLKADEKVVLTKITNPDQFRSTMKLSGTGTYRHIDEPNALWMIDASPVDALCIDGRHSLYACIDIATRRLVITLSKTPRASAVGLMMRKAILKLGAAKVVKTDNGSDFVAVSIKRLFADLDIEPDVSDAYSPEQKGHVERVIKTFQHEVCPQLPGYIGHSVADRKAIEGRKSFAQRLGADEKELFEVALTAEQLQRHIDDWLEYVYHEREHGGLKGRSPNEVAAASTAKITRVDERALDALLMPVAGKNGHRVMQKRGIQNDGFYYLAGSIMVGTDVFCRLDPLDMGRMYVFDGETGRYLDVAICAELSDVNPQAYVKAQKQIAAELLREKEREIKADLRDLKKGPSGIERTIELAKKKKAERAAGTANVIQLPKREQRLNTPAIAAALEAMTAPKVPQSATLNEKAAELHAAIVREAELKGSSTVIHLDPDAALSDSARMFKWAQAVEAQITSGVALDDTTAGKLARYKASADYQTRRDIFEDFGIDAALRG